MIGFPPFSSEGAYEFDTFSDDSDSLSAVKSLNRKVFHPEEKTKIYLDNL